MKNFTAKITRVFRPAKLRKYLNIHTNYAQTGAYGALGVNGGTYYRIIVQVPHAMVTNDTLTVQLPSVGTGLDPTFLPTKIAVPGFAAPGAPTSVNAVWPAKAGFTVTSHDTIAGITVLTALGAAAVGDVVILEYVEATSSATAD